MVIALLAILIIAAIIFMKYDYNTSEYKSGTSGGAIQTGRAVFGITDAAANMGSVTKVEVTIDEVSAHSETEGWMVVSSTPKTYDLLQLKASGDVVVLADAQISQGAYDQLRLKISKVIVTDANGTHEAKLPSGELKIVGGMDVKANETSSVKFDFIADESLHVTGNGKYIMAPVVQVETREDADVEIKSGNKVEISGGDVKTNAKFGMNIEGDVGIGLKVDKNIDLSIGDDGKVKAGSGIGLGLGASSSANTNNSGTSGISVGVGGNAGGGY